MSMRVARDRQGDVGKAPLDVFPGSGTITASKVATSELEDVKPVAVVRPKGRQHVVIDIYNVGIYLGKPLDEPITLVLKAPFDSVVELVRELNMRMENYRSDDLVKDVERPAEVSKDRVVIYNRLMFGDVLLYALALHGGAYEKWARSLPYRSRALRMPLAEAFLGKLENCVRFESDSCRDVVRAFSHVLEAIAR